jgi:hypothetical protein
LELFNDLVSFLSCRKDRIPDGNIISSMMITSEISPIKPEIMTAPRSIQINGLLN